MQLKWLEIALNVLFWVLTSWLIISVNSIELQEIEIIQGVERKQIFRNRDLIYYFLIGQFIFCIIFYIELFLIHQLGKTKAFRGFLLKSVLIICFLVLVYYLIIRFFVFSEAVRVTNISYGILIFYIASALGYGFIKMWIENERDKKQLELVKNQAELNLLKSQLQPHFLFNTMNNLLSMVDQKNNPKLAKSIDKLSGLLRYVVYETKSEKVPIAGEIEFIKNFAELHLLRFEDGEIDFKFEVNGVLDQQKIEPGILLCYVENAFKHGVQPEEHSFIYIKMNALSPQEISFVIENSIPKEIKLKQEIAGGFGLKSNLERLQLAYPGRHTIQIKEEATYLVTLTLQTDESYTS